MPRFPKNSFSWVALDYANRVTTGKIPACWQVRAAGQRFIADFNRADLVFDTARVDDVCDFAQAMPHVIGPLAGENIELSPFQVFILANIFGWLNKETRLRRYREAMILLPRGNAKSTLAAIIALHMTFREGQGGAQSLSGATSLKQAMAVFDPAKRMVEMTPEFVEELGVQTHARSIFQQSTGSSFQPVKAKTEDGGLPWLAVADELHQALDPTQLNAFRTGMGKRRGGDPLLLIISTAGTNLAGVCRQEQLYFESVLTGATHDDSKFALIYTIDKDDDWRDFSVWKKANPSYGIAVDEDHLKREYEKALQSPAHQAMALTKYLNVWQNSGSSWLNSVDWSKAASPGLTVPPGARCWLGVDLSTKTDLVAVCLVYHHEGITGVIPHLFIPSGALDRSKNSTAYAKWIEEGALISTEGSASDHQAVEDKVRELCKTYAVEAVMFDVYQAAGMIQRLQADGIRVMEFPQTAINMNQPMIDFEADLLNGHIRHSDNPVLNWMAANATLRERGILRSLGKPPGQDHLKIDGMVAMLMAFAGRETEAPTPPAPMLMFV